MSTMAGSISLAESSDSADRRRRIIAIIGASSGNLVEWYDFYAYAFTSIYSPRHFSPRRCDQSVAPLPESSPSGFSCGRGGLVVRLDCRHAWSKNFDDHSVLMMCGGSLLIACLPTYASIGAAAPVLLLVARLIQGLSVGGEYGTAATYMSEIAAKAIAASTPRSSTSR